jgi:hypothetical protein
MYERLAVAQNGVVQAAREVPYMAVTHDLKEALQRLDAEQGKSLLDLMPPELRAALTAASTLETALSQPLFPGLVSNQPAIDGDNSESEPKARYSPSQHRMTRCQSDDDGMCDWEHCPQLRDGEPGRSGRHCPLDKSTEEE